MAARRAALRACCGTRGALASTRRAAKHGRAQQPAVSVCRCRTARPKPRGGARPAARASCAPVLDVQAAQRKGGVVRVIDHVLAKRRLLLHLVQRLNCDPDALPRDAIRRHDEGRAAGDADAHRLCAGRGRHVVSARCGEAATAAAACRGSAAGAHVSACCRCPRSWGSHRIARQAPPRRGSAPAAPGQALTGAAFGRRSPPAGGCDAAPAQHGSGSRCRAPSGVGGECGVHACAARCTAFKTARSFQAASARAFRR